MSHRTVRHHRESAAVAECGAEIHDRGNVVRLLPLCVITDEVAQSSKAWCANNRGGNP